MPNHCANDLYILGHPEHVEMVLKHIRGPEENQLLDFNTLVPMPPELLEVSAGSEEQYYEALFGEPNRVIWAQDVDQPDRVSAHLSGTYSNPRILVFNAMMARYGTEGDALAAKVREAEQAAIKYRRNIEQWGHRTWYSWSIANWGTKWNAYDFGELVQRSSPNRKWVRQSVKFTFHTAWSPPVPVFEALVARFPSCRFMLRYFEGGCGFKGKVVGEAGEIVEQTQGSYNGHRGG